mmetsp:Transcript_4287/g.15096  ORF Transcript_4287/g.15096 Transcript_4287/m.15096 type:complete len:229 (-) Transcript_4287:143-829(-)
MSSVAHATSSCPRMAWRWSTKAMIPPVAATPSRITPTGTCRMTAGATRFQPSTSLIAEATTSISGHSPTAPHGLYQPSSPLARCTRMAPFLPLSRKPSISPTPTISSCASRNLHAALHSARSIISTCTLPSRPLERAWSRQARWRDAASRTPRARGMLPRRLQQSAISPGPSGTPQGSGADGHIAAGSRGGQRRGGTSPPSWKRPSASAFSLAMRMSFSASLPLAWPT